MERETGIEPATNSLEGAPRLSKPFKTGPFYIFASRWSLHHHALASLLFQTFPGRSGVAVPDISRGHGRSRQAEATNRTLEATSVACRSFAPSLTNCRGGYCSVRV